MFGTLGAQEMIFIFLLALLLFGPKKLPEIGRTIGKALTEFRRASNELKSTFEREMKTLEQENESLKQVTNEYRYDTYNYDYSAYDSGASESSYGSETYDSTAASPSTTSASAPQGAEVNEVAAPEGTIAYGAETTNESASLSQGTSESGSQPEAGVQAEPPAEGAPVSTTIEQRS
jgi:TatA/E family protein of Tat protein translocase